MLCKNCKKTVSIMDNVCPHCKYDLKKVDIAVSYAGNRSSSEPIKTPSGQSHSHGFKSQNEQELKKQHLSAFAVFKDVSMADIQVEVFHWKKLNWSLINCHVPFIQKLKITNNSKGNITDLIVRVKIAPDYGDSWDQTIKSISPGKSHIVESINLPLSRERLLSVKEAEQAFLKTQVNAKGMDIDLKTEPIEVLAYNEWFFNPLISESLAGFVLPNSSAVNEVIKHSAAEMETLGWGTAFDGYQSDNPDKVVAITEALYGVLQKKLKIKYINPPSSFEMTGQKILQHEDILEIGHGTCLDLALFYAACLERVGLYPLIFLVPGHAFLGLWLESDCFQEFHQKESEHHEEIVKKMEDHKNSAQERYEDYMIEKLERYSQVIIHGGFILPLNSTTFTTDNDFERCIREGLHILEKNTLTSVVDIAAVRNFVKPLPLQ